jgi:hypothetical protein
VPFAGAIIGCSTRSGAYTRWAWRFTFEQIQPSV